MSTDEAIRAAVLEERTAYARLVEEYAQAAAKNAKTDVDHLTEWNKGWLEGWADALRSLAYVTRARNTP